MSRRSRSASKIDPSVWRLIDDLTALEIRSTDAIIDHNGKVTHRSNYSPPTSLDIPMPHIPGPQPVPFSRPMGKPRFKTPQYADRVGLAFLDQYRPGENATQLAELDPNLLEIQLRTLPTWENINVVWNVDLNKYTNPNWNPYLKLDTFQGPVTFGPNPTDAQGRDVDGDYY